MGGRQLLHAAFLSFFVGTLASPIVSTMTLVPIAVPTSSSSGPSPSGGQASASGQSSSAASSISSSLSSSSSTSASTRSGFTKVTAAPSGVSVLSNKPYTLPTDGIATVCHSAMVPLKTSVWMQTEQVNLAGGAWFASDNDGKAGKTTNWTFSTNTSGVVLGWPSVPQAQDPQSGAAQVPFVVHNRTDPRFLDLTIGALSDNIMFQVYNDNGTDINNATWVDPKSIPKDSSARGRAGLGYESVLFQLNVEGYGACEYPVAEVQCRMNSPNLTAQNWEGYHVDEFLQKWNASKNGNYGGGGFMEAFKHDFGINTNQCNVQRECEMMPTCSAQGNPDSDDAIPAYLAYQAMSNLANFFNTLYTNVLNSNSIEANNIGSMVLNFFPNQTSDLSKNTPDSSSSSTDSSSPSTKTKASEGLGLGSMILGLISFPLLLIPGAGPVAAAAVGGVAAAGGLSGDAVSVSQSENGGSGGSSGSGGSTTTVIDSKSFANAAELGTSLNQLVTTLQFNIEQWQINTLSNGIQLAEMIKDGKFVDPQTSQFSTSDTGKAAAWLQKYLTIKLINKAWWLQNVFIAYVPYGLNATYGDSKKVLDQNACNDDFFKKAHDGEIIMCDTADLFTDSHVTGAGPGMMRLSMYDPSKVKPVACGNDGNGTIKIDSTPPGAGKSPSYDSADGQFQFNAQDLMRGSMRSWIKGGWGYDYASSLSTAQGTPDGNAALEGLAGLQNVNQTSPGMYNIPIIQINDMNYWPDTFSGSNFAGVRGASIWNKTITDPGLLPPQMVQFINQTDFPGKVKQTSCS